MGDGLNDKRPEEFLLADFQVEWNIKSSHVYSELVTIDCLLTYLEKIAAFGPCLDYLHMDRRIFLTVVYVTCYQGAVLRLWKLLDGPLDHLHQRTRANVLPEYKDEFDRVCGSTRQARRKVAYIKEKVDEHRNNVVAHLDLVNIEELSLPPLPVSELRTLFVSAKAMYGCLSPGTESITLPLQYLETSTGSWELSDNTDLDFILLSLLKDSPAVIEPESMGDHWKLVRSRMPPEEIEQLNHCRGLCGLPPA